MSYADYALIPAVRASRLKLMSKSPLHYREEQDRDTPSRGMLRAVHGLALEPARFLEDFATFHGPVRRGKEFEAFAHEHHGKTILTKGEFATASSIVFGMMRHPVARELLAAAGACEESIRWVHPGTGLACKGRIDKRIGTTVIDIKTYGTSDPRTIGRRIASLGAHLQAAHYCEGVSVTLGVPLESVRFLVIAAESASPWDVAVVELAYDDALALGRAERERLMLRIAECEASGVWPGACPAIVPVELPAWADPLLDGGDAVTFSEGT